MTTDIPTRSGSAIRNDSFGGGVAGSFLLHAAVAAALVGWTWYFHSGQNWGSSINTASAIQATMVNNLPPLRPQPIVQDNVLATETPSVAPAPPTPKAIAAPKPDAIPIPAKPTKHTKLADKTAPPPPPHPQPITPQLNKATAGEAAASIPMSSTQTRSGTFAIGETDTTFGTKFGYYNEQIKRKLESEWNTFLLDSQAPGHRVYITFRVGRDGIPTNARIVQPSGDATLDQTSLSAVRHVDSFGPLPDGYQGSYVDVTYYFDPPPRQ